MYFVHLNYYFFHGKFNLWFSLQLQYYLLRNTMERECTPPERSWAYRYQFISQSKHFMWIAFFWHNNITLIRNLDDYTQRFLIMNLIAYQICHIFSLIISLFYTEY